MRIRFTGTSSAIPTASSGFTSFLVEAGGQWGLVDAGDSPVRAILEAGMDPSGFAFVALTHRHADHLGAFPALIASLDCLKRTAPLDVAASPEVARDAQSLLEFFGLSAAKICFPLRFTESWRASGATLELLAGDHSVPTSMVRIRDGAAGLLYSADVAFNPGLVAANAGGCGTLVHEATYPEARLPAVTGHSSARQAGLAAAAAGVARLFLSHIDPPAWRGAGDPAEEARAVFPGEVIVPEPGRWYEIAP